MGSVENGNMLAYAERKMQTERSRSMIEDSNDEQQTNPELKEEKYANTEHKKPVTDDRIFRLRDKRTSKRVERLCHKDTACVLNWDIEKGAY